MSRITLACFASLAGLVVLGAILLIAEPWSGRTSAATSLTISFSESPAMIQAIRGAMTVNVVIGAAVVVAIFLLDRSKVDDVTKQ